MRRARGFTLVEVLVAISIFALLSAVAYGGLAQVLNSRDRVEAERAFWRGTVTLFRFFEEDLSQVRARAIRNSDGGELAAFVGRPVDSRALGEPSLEFTRGGLPVIGSSTRGDLQRVAYRLHEGKLYRFTWPSLDRAPQAKPNETVLAVDVEEFATRFYDSNKKLWSEEWPALGNANAPAGLPVGVEVRLRFKDRGEFTRLFSVGG